MNYVTIAKEVLDLEAAALLGAKEKLETYLEKTLDLIHATSGKLIVTGVGKSGLVGAKIAATFASTGTPSFFIHPTDCMHGDLGMISRGDTVIAISFSGESSELIQILPHLRRMQIPIIGMCKSPNSTLAKFSDCFVDIAVEKEACPLNSAPTTSTTLTLAIGDALAVCMMKKKNFKVEDFASFHPGGTLGKRLFVKAQDLALKDAIPQISPAATLKDAINEMTKGRLGNVLITQNGKLVGILSDGDLRRALMDERFSLDSPAINYANCNPKTAPAKDLLATQALQIIQKQKIQLLVLLDEAGAVSGVLHIHKLVEAGIET
ncbi:MAG: KpsF/GutQ family sugar-phosphate isomerase [Helicobacteraceae bacterium]